MCIGERVECAAAPYETDAAGILDNEVEFNIKWFVMSILCWSEGSRSGFGRSDACSATTSFSEDNASSATDFGGDVQVGMKSRKFPSNMNVHRPI